MSSLWRFPRSKALLTLTSLILVVQAVLTHALTRVEYLPAPPPLEQFPRTVGAWQHSQDGVLEPEVYELLGPDDLLNRDYTMAGSSNHINLFIAYYKTRLGANYAHDPKVCLPGSGWNPKTSKVIEIQATHEGEAVPVNHYVVAKGDVQAVVLYWYQTYKGSVAEERTLKFRRVLDTAFENRTDMALVRIVAPAHGNNLSEATARAIQFAHLIHPHLHRQFPPSPPGS